MGRYDLRSFAIVSSVEDGRTIVKRPAEGPTTDSWRLMTSSIV